MELDAVDRQLAVLQSHDFAFGGLSGHFETGGQRFSPDDQRMVPRRLEWIWKLFEDTGVAVLNGRSFSMHQSICGNDVGSEHGADALMPETNAEDRNSWTELADDFIADRSVLRPPRAR